ncbi:flagellar basal body P-ring formation protein FlgA [Nitrospina gracilis]|nr:flagellar basal body P-ring formation protein FlgA [Nitrospina gracilis]
MIFIKSRLKIIFIVLVGLCLSLTFEMRVNASETQVLKADEIEKSAMDHLVKALPWDKESLEINVYYQGKDITLPPGKKELIYKIMGSSQRAGRIPMILEIRINDQFQKRIRFNTKVLVSQKVIKIIRAVRRGELLSNDEIRVETIQTERPLKNAITNIDHALGYEATRSLSIGKILIPNFIKKPALGNRGDKILITARKGGMTITTPGILKEDGYKDAMVRVLNMDSKKIIYGRLVNSNTVRVRF